MRGSTVWANHHYTHYYVTTNHVEKPFPTFPFNEGSMLVLEEYLV